MINIINIESMDYSTDIFLNKYIHYDWFMSIFKDVIEQEGWTIINGATGRDYYIYEYNHRGHQIISKMEAIEYAKQYGWIVQSTGKILGFDINNLIRNKHLITGTELGLL